MTDDDSDFTPDLAETVLEQLSGHVDQVKRTTDLAYLMGVPPERVDRVLAPLNTDQP